MDPDELARFEGEQGLMAPSDYRIDGYSKDGIVGRMGFAPFRDDSPLEDVNLLCRAVDAASRSDPHAADKVAAGPNAGRWMIRGSSRASRCVPRTSRSTGIPVHGGWTTCNGGASTPWAVSALHVGGTGIVRGAPFRRRRGLVRLRCYAYAAREDDDRQMWCSDDGYIVDADLPNCLPVRARLEDALRPSRPERPSWIRPTRRTWP